MDDDFKLFHLNNKKQHNNSLKQQDSRISAHMLPTPLSHPTTVSFISIKKILCTFQTF